MSDIQMLKKLGAKQITGDVKKHVKEKCANDGDHFELYSIWGTANGVKTGTSNFGDWMSFVGQMEAVNRVTGEMFAAAHCFIPEPLSTMLKVALQDHDTVDFAFTVSVKRRDDLQCGYEYLVKPHKAATESDPLEKLRNLIPALPSPETDTKTAKSKK